MTSILGSNVELQLYWKGKYRWCDDWKITGVTLTTETEVVARINRQLPPNDKQQLAFSMSSQEFANNHKFSFLIDFSDIKALSTIKCSVAAARALRLHVNILYTENNESMQESQSAPYTKNEIIPPLMTLPHFNAGDRYDIILSHEDNKINVVFEKEKNSNALIFNLLTVSLNSFRGWPWPNNKECKRY